MLNSAAVHWLPRLELSLSLHVTGGKMAEILRCEKPSLELLARKWQRVADEIEAEATARNHGSTAQLLMNIVEVSKRRLGIGNVHLRPNICVVHIETPVEIEDAEIFRDAWLGFPDELEALLYLRGLWLRRILRVVDGSGTVTRETYELMEKAMDICVREKRFPNETLEAFILNGIRDLAGAEIKKVFCLSDEYSIMELYVFDIDANFGELKEIVDGYEFDIHDEHHMKLLEEWMATTAYPRGRSAAWEMDDGEVEVEAK
jgi:hypothetical protein